MFNRILDINKIKYSLFLFGPRQVGKTFLLKQSVKYNLYINLLDYREYLRYSKDISYLSKEIKALDETAKVIVIDEIQRVPELLNEVHLLLNEYPSLKFILTGSSARKLRQKGVNLLGGRALTYKLYPLTFTEIGDKFNFEEVLQYGSLPHIVNEPSSDNKVKLLKSYTELYLKEEIEQESIVRNLPAFAKFLDLSAFENGKLINYQKISNDIGVHAKTIKEYFQILEDTLIGFSLYPYRKSSRKKIVSHPKFYFFDTGVVNALKGTLRNDLVKQTREYGELFEHFIILELIKTLEYNEIDYNLSFFRTTDGTEIDLILELNHKSTWAIEIKSNEQPNLRELKGLLNAMKDHTFDRVVCICQTLRKYIDKNIEFYPWQDFLKQINNLNNP